MLVVRIIHAFAIIFAIFPPISLTDESTEEEKPNINIRVPIRQRNPTHRHKSGSQSQSSTNRQCLTCNLQGRPLPSSPEIDVISQLFKPAATRTDNNPFGGTLSKLLSNNEPETHQKSNNLFKARSEEMTDAKNSNWETSTTDGDLALTIPDQQKQGATEETKPEIVSDPNEKETQDTHTLATRSSNDIEDIVGAPMIIIDQIRQIIETPFGYRPESLEDENSSSCEDEADSESGCGLGGIGGNQGTRGTGYDVDMDDDGGIGGEDDDDEIDSDDSGDRGTTSTLIPPITPGPMCGMPLTEKLFYPLKKMTQCASMRFIPEPCACTNPPPCVTFKFPERQHFDIPLLPPVKLVESKLGNLLSHVVGARSIANKTFASAMPSWILLTLSTIIVSILTLR
ncbi:uncharacterized protein [Amphiura filiformis]|uniref:uncharacterized protein n=1 Tax=Amphiura filiformis TaxID=82378 RepID=UPI003B218369